MPNQYYSSNNKVTGSALFASFNSKDGAIYFKLLRQIANNPDKRGNFDGKNPLNIKLTQDEAADIIRTVREKSESKFFHTFKESKTTGNFKFYTIPAKDTFPAKSGYGLSVKRTDGEKSVEIKTGFTLAGAERLSLFLQHALSHIFQAEYAQDIKDAKEYRDKKQTAAQPATNNEPVVEEPDSPPADSDESW